MLSRDRQPTNERMMMLELMANMLGLHGKGVTATVRHVHAAGSFEYNGGPITVLERAGLERRRGECNAVVKREYDCLLPPGRPL